MNVDDDDTFYENERVLIPFIGIDYITKSHNLAGDALLDICIGDDNLTLVGDDTIEAFLGAYRQWLRNQEV